uniref:Transmembrane protein n=1 Tax=Phaseolus vulgaris TaxID=3885 RepID=V7B6A3_PHAVU|nr:hypothetical protein PHAVU_008G167600g [Phaseolus vulgaris]ESW13095.1 hypothetical protein PHAVU_008G167600g [Phaseolus vulgaris]
MLLKIQRWLQQPKVRKLACFVSSIVGLLCYALSSSFNQLFGEWTWWKILLYILFTLCIIIFFLSKFTSTRERPTSPPLEAHSAFLVLIITSMYSFFVDKKLKGKPDVYSLVSNAAFAIMSLGLSTLSPFGFEVDLLYFFSGVLIVQLMKIKLWLVIVGGCFSYSLIRLRSILDPQPLYVRSQDLAAIRIDPRSQSQSKSQVSSGSVSLPDSPHVPVPPQADPTHLGSPLQQDNSPQSRTLIRHTDMTWTHFDTYNLQNLQNRLVRAS